ncbi:MAG: HEAT repeat domain-containing protein [Firmicutes bacterium]|nr:HEAT repeat domain-containing protein [Bacillota bacterium]
MSAAESTSPWRRLLLDAKGIDSSALVAACGLAAGIALLVPTVLLGLAIRTLRNGRVARRAVSSLLPDRKRDFVLCPEGVYASCRRRLLTGRRLYRLYPWESLSLYEVQESDKRIVMGTATAQSHLTLRGGRGGRFGGLKAVVLEHLQTDGKSAGCGLDAGNADEANRGRPWQAGILASVALAVVVWAVAATGAFCHQYRIHQVERASANLQSGNVETRLAAIAALSSINGPEAKTALLTALKDKNSTVRAAAATRLRGWADNRALAALIVAFRGNNDGVRRYAADALLPSATADTSTSEVAARRMEAASDALEKAFRRKDHPAIVGGVEYFIGKGKDGTEPTLISALRARGTKGKAETYLNCGNTKLETAAKQWAKDHGYTIQTHQARYPTVTRGSNRRE